MDHHIKDIATKHEAYFQDTPDFLRVVNEINKGQNLKQNTKIVTMDATALFTNIIHKEGLKCLEDALNRRKNPKVPTHSLVKLMEII